MLVVFGAINLDLVFPVHRLPSVGETVRREGGWSEPGGKAALQALAAHRDGAEVTLVGAVGDDELGTLVLRSLERHGLGCGHVARIPGDTGRAALAIADDGYTIVLVDPGANRHARADQVPDALLGQGSTLLLQMEVDPAEVASLVARARARGARIVLNFSPPGLIDARTLQQVDILVSNAKELSWLAEHLGCGNSPSSINAALGVTVVGMSGVQGVEAVSADGYWRIEALPVSMRDTTAAGDAFVGVFAAALSRGADLPDAFRRAVVGAGLAVTKVGTGRTMPEREAVESALDEAPELLMTQPEMSE